MERVGHIRDDMRKPNTIRGMIITSVHAREIATWTETNLTRQCLNLGEKLKEWNPNGCVDITTYDRNSLYEECHSTSIGVDSSPSTLVVVSGCCCCAVGGKCCTDGGEGVRSGARLFDRADGLKKPHLRQIYSVNTSQEKW